MASSKKLSPLQFLKATLPPRYTFKLWSTETSRKREQYSVVAWIAPARPAPARGKKSISETSYINARALGRRYAGRTVTTDELNRLLKKDPIPSFMRASYATHLRTRALPNFFVFRFSLKKK